MSVENLPAPWRALALADRLCELAHAPSVALPPLLQDVLEHLVALLALPAGAIFLADPQSAELALVAAWPHDGLLERWATHPAARSTQTGIAVELGGTSPVAEQATLALPLQVGARQIGLLEVLPPPERLAQPDQYQRLASLAARLAAAIDQSRHASGFEAESERMRALIDASNDAIIMLDSQGVITMLNRRAKYFFGLTEAEALGQSSDQLRAIFRAICNDGPRFDAWMLQLLASPEERMLTELKVQHAEPRLLQCYSAPVRDHRERWLGRMLVFRDITREREVEQMKTDFVSIVSHELRTPLTSMRGSLQLALGRAASAAALPPTTRELIEISLKNSERLIRLINDILDVAKIEQGAIRLRLAAQSPAKLCHIAAREMASFAEERKLGISVRVADDLPLVDADRDRALQVLANLISNAIKFSNPGQQIEVGAAQASAMICFQVRDYGRGIAHEDHQRIFEKFHQIDSSLTRNVGGTGLGLAISKALVEEHGGQIWLESLPGLGTTFYFTLPLAHGRPEQEDDE